MVRGKRTASHWPAHHASSPTSAVAVDAVLFATHLIERGFLGPTAGAGVRYASQAEPLATPAGDGFLLGEIIKKGGGRGGGGMSTWRVWEIWASRLKEKRAGCDPEAWPRTEPAGGSGGEQKDIHKAYAWSRGRANIISNLFRTYLALDVASEAAQACHIHRVGVLFMDRLW